MEKYKSVFLCVSIVLVMFLILFIFLIYNRVGNAQDTYLFCRKYSDNTVKWNLEELPRPDSLDFLQGSKSKKVDSVELNNHYCLSFGPVGSKTSAPFAFSCYPSGKDGQSISFMTFKYAPSCDYSNIYGKGLAFDGVFLKIGNYVTYTFRHLPSVLVFDAKGRFMKDIHTNDNVPCPSIIRYKEYYIYERGKAFNSNVSSFVKGQFVYVFSYRIPRMEKRFIVDVYSLETGRYQYSVNIDNKGKYANTDIDKVFSVGKEIYIDTRMDLLKLSL